jgi:hypothetical protein
MFSITVEPALPECYRGFEEFMARVILVLVLSCWFSGAQSAPDAPAQFTRAVDKYLELRRKIDRQIADGKAAKNAAELAAWRSRLAGSIRAARAKADPGEILVPAIRPRLLEAIRSALAGRDGEVIRAALKETDPARPEVAGRVKVAVNAPYPADAAQTTMPPALLSRLPRLPAPLAYQFVGSTLLVNDSDAGIILDFLPDALPGPDGASQGSEAALLPGLPGSVRFLAVGDAGTGERPQYEVARRMAELRQEWPFDFVILLGDNLYGRENPIDYVRKFERPYQALLEAGVKFYASLGNHDQDGQVHYARFNMNGRAYYSFRQGPARFFALNSKYMDPKQLAWLEIELKNSDEEWKIAFFHHPLYSSGRRHGSDLSLRKVLEPLFIKHGVNAVFSGHEHFYERIKPQHGIHYFIAGAAGKLRRDNIEPSDLTERGFDVDNSFLAVELAGDRMYFRAISRAGETVDSGIILMNRKAAPTSSLAPGARSQVAVAASR